MSDLLKEKPAETDSYFVDRESDATPTISVVMPTMNEEEGIAECITRAKSAFAELGVTGEIVVSDSSDDRTTAIAREMGARVVEPDRPGYGYAYRYAFERIRGDYVVMGDADTTYDFEELPRLVQHLNQTGSDVVMGSRLDGEIKSGSMPLLHRYLGNPLLTRFLNVFYDAGVSDAHSGFRILTREALNSIDLECDGMEFASEMVIDAVAKGLHIEEVPITYHEREGKATLNSFQDGWRHLKFMLVNAPAYLFSLPGLIVGLLGISVMALGLSEIRFFGQALGIHSLIAGSLLTLVGYQIAGFGILTDIVADPIKRHEDPITHWIRTNFTLERGVAVGIGLTVVGTAAAGYLIYRWIQSDFTVLPLVSIDIVAFTAIVLGIQTVFWSFFASIVNGE